MKNALVLPLVLAITAGCSGKTVVKTVSGLPADASEAASNDAAATPDVEAAGADEDVAAADTAPPPDTAQEAFSVACPDGLQVVTEEEANDHWSSSNDVGTPSSPGFCVQGRVLCGNDGKDGYANPGDHFVFRLTEAQKVEFELRWDVASDFDLLMSHDFDSGQYLISFESGVGKAEGGSPSLDGGTPYYLSINCWEGAPGDFALVARW